MKLRESRFVPKRRSNILLKILDTALCAGLVLMWFFHETLGISAADMFIISGLIIIAVIFASANSRTERKLKAAESHNEKLRDEIGKDKFGDNSVFFD